MNITINEDMNIQDHTPENIFTAERIHNEIRIYLESGLTHIEALLEYAERSGIEIHVLGEIVKRSDILKSKVKEDAQNIHMLKKDNEEEIATLF